MSGGGQSDLRLLYRKVKFDSDMKHVKAGVLTKTIFFSHQAMTIIVVVMEIIYTPIQSL